MTQFSVEIKNLDQLTERMRRYPDIAEPILQKAIDASNAVLAKYTRKGDPVPWKTGNLLQSFRYESGRLQGRWYPTANYALYVHEGTRPHIIEAKNKRALASRSGQVFGKRVRHPGTRAQRFMPAILERSTQDIEKLFDSALDKITKEIAKSI